MTLSESGLIVSYETLFIKMGYYMAPVGSIAFPAEHSFKYEPKTIWEILIFLVK